MKYMRNCDFPQYFSRF